MADRILPIYIVEDLDSARRFLNNHEESIIITNPLGSTRYYGVMVLDYIFKVLSNEFPQIVKIIIEIGDDHAALFSAIKLGYYNINYTGISVAAKKMLSFHLGSRGDLSEKY